MLPAQILAGPLIAAIGFTVTVILTEQPDAIVYTTVVVPPFTAHTIPVVAPTVATVVLEELHVPPPAPSLSCDALPWHMVVVPDIGVMAFTVKLSVTVQPAGVL